jgi:hypothetical protein
LVWDKLPGQERNKLIRKYNRAIYKNYTIWLSRRNRFTAWQITVRQIRRNIEFYKPITLSYLSDEAQVLQSAERIKEHTKAINPNYITEIDLSHCQLWLGL